MTSQEKLGRMFENGDTTGKASNMTIEECQDGTTLLVGYGHAVYAERNPNGEITVYNGWAMSKTRRRSGSTSTKSQFAQIPSGDTQVAYTSTSTDRELEYRRNSDIVTDEIGECAPKLSSYDTV